MDATSTSDRVPPRNRLGRRLFVSGVFFAVAFVIIAGGAYPRYNRIAYGTPPLALALTCIGAAAYLTRRAAASAVCSFAVAAGTFAVWMEPSLAGAVEWEPRMHRAHVLLTLPTDRRRAALFAELQPVEIVNCGMERFGERHDGGYLLCGNLLESVNAGYSYGIGPTDKWGCDVALRLGAAVHQYDCFDPARPVCARGTTVFHPECVGPTPRTDGDGRVFGTLEQHLARNGDTASRIVVKMDIEGAEWDSLLHVPSAVLDRIEQLDIEFHGVGLELHLAVVRRLKEFFHVANLHFTNFACAPRLDPFPAWAYEALFVSKRIARAGSPRPPGPHPLDAPNAAEAPDCQGSATRWSLGGLTSWLSTRAR